MVCYQKRDGDDDDDDDGDDDGDDDHDDNDKKKNIHLLCAHQRPERSQYTY